jgi:drug/metabolite transporter superfamily protein YnfA
MALEAALLWILALALCELAYAASVASLLGGAGVTVLTLSAWLVRLDLDLLATLLAATYGSVFVCLSLVQTHLEGFPGTPAAPGRGGAAPL